MQTDERYQMVETEHGGGGFGKISKQRDTILERLVAVKSLLILEDQSSRERFINEAKILARMSHPNIPAIYDVKFGKQDMRIYFEFIDGSNLREVIAEGSYPSMEEAKRWFSQVASALEHANSMGIVHRDVKPANIIISTDRSSAFLVDFGIALTADDVKRITEQGYVIGTPGYMSPEQMEGKELDGRSDIYSLGITLYEALCGHSPQIGDYKSLADANEAIPPAIDELIKQSLIQDKQRRLGSAKDFILGLRSAFRTDIPLSSVLTDARLHELHAALQGMSAEEFSGKPKGQRLLIINRIKDLTRIDKPTLRRPTAEMIALLVRLAIYEPTKEYSVIVNAGYEWGYEKWYGPTWQGDDVNRDALTEASKSAPNDAHQTISQVLLEFVEKQELTDKPHWYLHDLRLNVMGLLANQHCDAFAERLATIYDQINEISHEPTVDVSRDTDPTADLKVSAATSES